MTREEAIDELMSLEETIMVYAGTGATEIISAAAIHAREAIREAIIRL